jgi:hypothetical protein
MVLVRAASGSRHRFCTALCGEVLEIPELASVGRGGVLVQARPLAALSSRMRMVSNGPREQRQRAALASFCQV